MNIVVCGRLSVFAATRREFHPLPRDFVCGNDGLNAICLVKWAACGVSNMTFRLDAPAIARGFRYQGASCRGLDLFFICASLFSAARQGPATPDFFITTVNFVGCPTV